MNVAPSADRHTAAGTTAPPRPPRPPPLLPASPASCSAKLSLVLSEFTNTLCDSKPVGGRRVAVGGARGQGQVGR